MNDEATTERSLVEKFKALSYQKAILEGRLEALNAEISETGDVLIEGLSAQGKTETATYEGLGYALLAKPRVSASCAQENKARLFDFLASIGRNDLIRTDVNSKSLTSFVLEMLEKGDGTENLPEFINVFFVPNVQLRGEDGRMIGYYAQKPSPKRKEK